MSIRVMKKMSKARIQHLYSAVFISVYKPVGLCTGECIHVQKNLAGVGGWDYTGRRVGLLMVCADMDISRWSRDPNAAAQTCSQRK